MRAIVSGSKTLTLAPCSWTSDQRDGETRATHPDQAVVDQVEAVTDLPAEGGGTQDRVADLHRLRGRLEVLDELANAHDCALSSSG